MIVCLLMFFHHSPADQFEPDINQRPHDNLSGLVDRQIRVADMTSLPLAGCEHRRRNEMMKAIPIGN
jgi:hypothetical protein